MTKKDYKLIADCISKCEYTQTKNEFIDCFIEMLARYNANFDKDKFYKYLNKK